MQNLDGGFAAYFAAANACNVPSFADGPLFCAFLRAAFGKLGNLERSVARDNQRLPGILLENLRRLRASLSTMLMHFAEKMGPQSGDKERVPGGWTRFTLAYAVALRCTSVLLVAAESRVADALARYDAAQSRYLTRNGFVCFPGPGATSALSMSQLELAAGDVLRARLDSADSMHPDLHTYVSALEARCAALAFPNGALPVTREDFDNLSWTQEVPHASSVTGKGSAQARALPEVTSAFFNVTAWWFVWTRRYINSYVRVSERSFWSKTYLPHAFAGHEHAAERVETGPYVTVPWTGGVPQALQFMERFSKTLSTDEHARAWKTRTGTKFEVLPGDFDVFSCRGGAAADEQPTVRGVLDVMRTTAQARYSAFGRYKRPIYEWLAAAKTRVVLTQGKLGGAPPGHLHEQLAFLHVTNTYFLSLRKVPWFAHYTVFQRAGHMKLAVGVQKAARNGVPFLVQRFGRWACCVPVQDPHERTRSRAFDVAGFEERVARRVGEAGGASVVRETQKRRTQGAREGAVEIDSVQIYEAPNAYTAVTLWCAAVLEGPWQGTLHGNVQCAAILENVFAV